jgi:molecular chaperone HtpG
MACLVARSPDRGCSLYYDIELRGAIRQSGASDGMFPTTTLITKDRIFVPVPDALAKDFLVRFDVLSSDP